MSSSILPARDFCGLGIVENESFTWMAAFRRNESNFCSLQNGLAILTNASSQVRIPKRKFPVSGA
ncbi:MAG: hypothetical protein JO251_14485 [Verrucomicrobia bacterium]|nr:hypothetical protein [Verrucomicrobiota bacterium]